MHSRHRPARLALALTATLLTSSGAHSEVIVRMETNLGDIYIELFDQTAPNTVANFLNYVRDNDYQNTFIHRSAILSGLTPTILQGGGYINNSSSYALVPTDDPIALEYSDDRPNTRGTIAMARTSDPDSATSEWFFNVVDNTSVLGASNGGGYAVFGRVLGSNTDTNTTNDGPSMAVVDMIAALPRWNGNGIASANDTPDDDTYDDAWTEIPLIDFSSDQTFDPDRHFVNIPSITEVNYLLRTTSRAGNTVTLTAPSPATLSNLVVSGSPAASTAPAGVNFREGFFSFEINNLTPGGAVSVAMELPEDYKPNTYYMYGKTPDNRTDHWYEFKYNGRTGAEFFNNNFVVLHFVDGERGDNDLTANGTISDPGAPGIASASSSGGGGGGCTLMTNSTARSMDVGLLGLLFAAYIGYRARRCGRSAKP